MNEQLKFAAEFFMALAWPVAILVIFFSIRKDLVALLRQTHTRLSAGKGLRARFGSIELDFETKKDLEEVAEQIESETNPKERLKRAQLIAKKDSILKELSEDDVQALQDAQRLRCPDAFLVDWYNIASDERARIAELCKKGLIGSYMIYNDEMCHLTPLGKEVAKALAIDPTSNS
jgi:hypothetical protein